MAYSAEKKGPFESTRSIILSGAGVATTGLAAGLILTNGKLNHSESLGKQGDALSHHADVVHDAEAYISDPASITTLEQEASREQKQATTLHAKSDTLFHAQRTEGLEYMSGGILASAVVMAALKLRALRMVSHRRQPN